MTLVEPNDIKDSDKLKGTYGFELPQDLQVAVSSGRQDHRKDIESDPDLLCSRPALLFWTQEDVCDCIFEGLDYTLRNSMSTQSEKQTSF